MKWCIKIIMVGTLIPTGFAKKNEEEVEEGARRKNINSQGQIKKSGDKTSIDFDEVDISGARKTPLGSLINQAGSDKNYDFIKLRLNWHPEMIYSAYSLDTKAKSK